MDRRRPGRRHAHDRHRPRLPALGRAPHGLHLYLRLPRPRLLPPVRAGPPHPRTLPDRVAAGPCTHHPGALPHLGAGERGAVRRRGGPGGPDPAPPGADLAVTGPVGDRVGQPLRAPHGLEQAPVVPPGHYGGLPAGHRGGAPGGGAGPGAPAGVDPGLSGPVLVDGRPHHPGPALVAGTGRGAHALLPYRGVVARASAGCRGRAHRGIHAHQGSHTHQGIHPHGGVGPDGGGARRRPGRGGPGPTRSGGGGRRAPRRTGVQACPGPRPGLHQPQGTCPTRRPQAPVPPVHAPLAGGRRRDRLLGGHGPHRLQPVPR